MASISFTSKIASLFLALLLFSTSTWALCYTPDGGLSNDISCNPSPTKPSICCKFGYSCTEANLCLREGHANSSGLAFDGQYTRGTCSDKTWQSPECGGHCVNGNPSGGELVQYCGDGKFCCGDNPNCCNDKADGILQLREPKIYAVAGVSSQTTLTTSATSAPQTNEASSDGRREDNSKVVAVGVGLGVTLGVVLVAIVGVVVWWKRRAAMKNNAPALTELGANEKPLPEPQPETHQDPHFETYRVEMPRVEMPDRNSRYYAKV